MKTKNSLTVFSSQKIKNLAFVSAVLVVCIHISFQMNGGGVLSWTARQLVGRGLAGVAVPFFFLVSGYFIGQHVDEIGWYKKGVKKRVVSLLLPFFLWSAIAICSYICRGLIADCVASRPLGSSIAIGAKGVVRYLGLDMTSFPLLEPLWYVRNLFLLVLTAPILVLGVKRFKLLFVGVLFLSLFLVDMIPNGSLNGFLRCGYSVVGLCYFSIGLSVCLMDIRYMSRKSAVICSVLTIVMLLVDLVIAKFGSVHEARVRTFLVPFALYSLWYYIPARPWPKWLTDSSFAIYLAHYIVLEWWVLISRYLPIPYFGLQCLALVISILIPIVFRIVISRHCKCVAEALFGGRV